MSKNHRANGGFTPFKPPAGAQSAPSTRESYALCGARLKKLFEKSFFRIFKSFQHFYIDQKFPPFEALTRLFLFTVH